MRMASNKQIISVCLPVYNAAPYIADTIASIQAQDWKDLRILVQDNASSDGTSRIVRGISERDPRIELQVNPENIGYCGNIRRALDRADTDLVCVFHGDDLYRPGLISAEYAALKESGAAAAFSSYRIFYGNPSKSMPYPIGPDFQRGSRWFVGGLDEYLPILLERGNPFACPTLLTYRRVLLDLGAFTDRYPSNEDLDLWIRYLKTGRRLAIVRERLFLYRRSAAQGSAYWDNRDELPVYFDLIDEELLKEKPAEGRTAAAYDRLKAKALLQAAANAAKAGRQEKARGFMERSIALYKMRLLNGGWYLFQRSLPTYLGFMAMKESLKRMIQR